MKNVELKELQIGEVVAIPIKDLGIPNINILKNRMYIADPKENVTNEFLYWFEIYRYIDNSIIIDEELKNWEFKDDFEKYVTLLKYEGYGIFTELYTNEKIALRMEYSNDVKNLRFVNSYDFNIKYTKIIDIDCGSFLEHYEELKEIPLSIDVWYPLNNKTKARIYEQEQEADKLKNFIFCLINQAKDKLENDKKYTVVEDFDIAQGENIIYDFIHSSNLVTNNQSNEEKVYEREPKQPRRRQFKV